MSGFGLARRLALELRLYVANHVVAHVPSHTLRLLYYRGVMGFRIGRDSSIFMDTTFDAPGRLSIGAASTINHGCRLDSRGWLTIGDCVSISGHVIILTAEHDIQSSAFDGVEEPVTVEDYVFIGTRATILPGVTVGRGAVVAAGAVVTRNVEPYAVVGGVPARRIGSRGNDLAYNVRYRRLLQ